MSGAGCTAFIDLLATKQSLDIGRDNYISAIRLLRQALQSNIKHLDSRDRVYAFSDCAFIEFKDLDIFYQFIQGMRASLFPQRLYFRCGIADGALEPEDIREKVDRYKTRINGFVFGDKAVDAFLLHEKFKGIGCIIDEKVAKKNEELTVPSAYYPAESRKTPVAYRDFPLSFDRVEDEREILNRFVREFKKQNTRSKRIGRYYLSLLITWVNSSSFSETKYDAKSRSFDPASPLLELLLLDRSFEDYLAELYGHELIYFSLFSRLHEEEVPQNIQALLITKFRKKLALRRKVGEAPRFLLADKLKNEILDQITL